MMQILWFTLVGIGIYLISNAILTAIERRRGKLLEHRSIIFFVIFLVLVISSFELINYLNRTTAPPPGQPVENSKLDGIPR